MKPSQQRINYRGRGFDRGHLAHYLAMRVLRGRPTQRASFYCSNISHVVAQRCRLNQLGWQHLEEIEIDHIAPRIAPLWIVTGRVPAKGGRLPCKFHRTWQTRDADGYWRSLAFIVAQQGPGDGRLSRYRVSIDSIETATGINFFLWHGHGIQHRLEAYIPPASTFGFARYARQNARYQDDLQNRNGIHLNFDRCGG